MQGTGSSIGAMSEDVAMQIWPTIYDGITWSDIGEVAIATSEHVELLVGETGKFCVILL